jgi:hypothetical protein
VATLKPPSSFSDKWYPEDLSPEHVLYRLQNIAHELYNVY